MHRPHVREIPALRHRKLAVEGCQPLRVYTSPGETPPLACATVARPHLHRSCIEGTCGRKSGLAFKRETNDTPEYDGYCVSCADLCYMRLAKIGNERAKKRTGRVRKHRLRQAAMEQQMRCESSSGRDSMLRFATSGKSCHICHNSKLPRPTHVCVLWPWWRFAGRLAGVPSHIVEDHVSCASHCTT
jgi:hypothetical protein